MKNFFIGALWGIAWFLVFQGTYSVFTNEKLQIYIQDFKTDTPNQASGKFLTPKQPNQGGEISANRLKKKKNDVLYLKYNNRKYSPTKVIDICILESKVPTLYGLKIESSQDYDRNMQLIDERIFEGKLIQFFTSEDSDHLYNSKSYDDGDYTNIRDKDKHRTDNIWVPIDKVEKFVEYGLAGKNKKDKGILFDNDILKIIKKGRYD